MKTFIPRHIDAGFFNITLPFGPINITIIQLFIIAGGAAFGLVLWNQMVKSGVDKGIAFLLVLPIFLIAFGIAFFKMTELKLLAFIAKIIRTNFFDETTKYQVNYSKIDPLDVKIKSIKSQEQKVIIQTKSREFDKEKVKRINKFID